MPPVSHSISGQKFDYRKSELVQWALEQKDILDWLCQCLFNTGYIKYDENERKWCGIEHESEKENC